jgi:ParB/RepB/Spo0J family partition protein
MAPVNSSVNYEFRNPEDAVIGRMNPTSVVLVDPTTGKTVETFKPENNLPAWRIALLGLDSDLEGDYSYGDKTMVSAMEGAINGKAYPVQETAGKKASGKKKASAGAGESASVGEAETDDGQTVFGEYVELDPEVVIAGKNPRGETPNPEGMAESFRQVGQLQNIVVAPADKKGRYALIAGWTRHAAALHNKASFPGKPQTWMLKAIIMDPENRHIIGLIENAKRTDMGTLAVARALQVCLDEGLTQRQIAKQTGFSTSHISNLLGVLDLPKPALALVESGVLNQTMAVKLSKMNADELKLAMSNISEQVTSGEDAPRKRGQMSQIDFEAVTRSARGQSNEPEADADADADGDNEETEETPVNLKMSRREIDQFLTDSMIPGADPAQFEICGQLKKFFDGQCKIGAVEKKFKLFTRKDGKVADTGIISEPKARGAKA